MFYITDLHLQAYTDLSKQGQLRRKLTFVLDDIMTAK